MSDRTRMFSRFRSSGEREKLPSNILAPIGLQRFAERIIPKALAGLGMQGQKIRIRMLPVASLQHGDTVAMYQNTKDYIQVHVPLNIYRSVLLQKSLFVAKSFAREMREELRDMSEQTFSALRFSKLLHMERTLEDPGIKPTYKPESQESYELNRDFDVIDLAIELYIEFLLSYENLPEINLTPEEKETLIKFVRKIEKILIDVDEVVLKEYLEKTSLFPDFYFLACAVLEVDPHTLEISDRLNDLVSDSIRHEAIHQVFRNARDQELTKLAEEKLKSDQGKTKVSSDDTQEEREAEEFNKNHLARVIKCEATVNDTVKSTISFSEGFSRLREINLETFLAITEKFTGTRLEVHIMRSIATGLEEIAIAMIMAQKANENFLLHLTTYITSFDFILPSLEVLTSMQEIITQYSKDSLMAVREIQRRYYTLEAIQSMTEKISAELLSKQTSTI